VLAIGILARFYKCLEQPTSDGHFVFKQRLQLERERPRQCHQGRCSLESSIPVSPFLCTYGIAISYGRPIRVAARAAHSCSPMFSQPASRRVCVHDHLIASRNYSTMIRAISTKTFLTGGASTSDSQRSLRLNRSDFQCHSKRPRNQVLQVLETVSATCYSVGLLTIMRYNTSYGGSPLAKLFRCSRIRGAIYLLHTALELAAGATN
jgi:hypothetical protein